MTRKHILHHLGGLAFVVSVSGCSVDAPDNAASGGALNAGIGGQSGSAQTTQSGGNTATILQATGGLISAGGTSDDTTPASAGATAQQGAGGAAQVATGGAAQVSTGGAVPIVTGGAAQVSTGGAALIVTGGAMPIATGGAAQISSGGAAQTATGGAEPIATGGAVQVATGGAAEVSTGGAAEVSTGGVAQTATGGAAQIGTGGTSQVESTTPEEPLCVDETGAEVPYDFSNGIMGEYAFELSMSCDVGGYLMPLIMADPDQLTQVSAFVADATDWYRADVLNCTGATTQLDQNSFGLLPVSQSADLSDADFDASLALFSMVLDRHDGQPDAVSASKKDKIKNRIKSVKARAVHGGAAGLTKTLTEPDCVPAAGGAG